MTGFWHLPGDGDSGDGVIASKFYFGVHQEVGDFSHYQERFSNLSGKSFLPSDV